MAERAQVSSVEAVESFRADLIVFQSRARVVLEEACDEVLRAKTWVQIDRRRYWIAEARRRGGKLEKARADLSSARLSQFNESTTLPMMMVQRAERADREAKAKIAILKKWDRELENRTDPLLKQVTQLQWFMARDMGQAVAYLAKVVRTLEAYADVAQPGTSTVPVGTKTGANAGKGKQP
jgi:uncharacterized pyridoxal phosphate-containing UPF0001 family protein